MENLRKNVLGLEEEVLQRGSDTPEVSMKSVRKVRPELLTSDPALLRSLPDNPEEMDEGDYLASVLGALGTEYADDEAMQGMTGGQRIEQLMRKHPKQLDNIFNEIGRLQQGRADEALQEVGTTITAFGKNSDGEVEYYQNRKSPNESREEFRARTNDDRKERKSNERQQLINNAPFGY